MPKILPSLWFDNNAEEAVNFYKSVFKDVKINSVSRYGDSGPGPKGSVQTMSFSIKGQEFLALNGGPHFKFNPAVSFIVNCDDQEEIDDYWDKLTSGGGKPVRCGWLEDKFGLSWQIVPSILEQLMTKGGAEKSSSVMKALLQMDKIDIAGLKKAYEQA